MAASNGSQASSPADKPDKPVNVPERVDDPGGRGMESSDLAAVPGYCFMIAPEIS